MSTHQYSLRPAPVDADARKLWLTHAAGFILFEDVRGYAIEQLAPGLSAEARQAALEAIDHTLYGLMMVLDGVTGALDNETHVVELQVAARYVASREDSDGTVEDQLDLRQSDGMCAGFHGWKEGDFGDLPIVDRLDEE
jgi:hypothetical protein